MFEEGDDPQDSCSPSWPFTRRMLGSSSFHAANQTSESEATGPLHSSSRIQDNAVDAGSGICVQKQFSKDKNIRNTVFRVLKDPSDAVRVEKLAETLNSMDDAKRRQR
jgi:hypothetical protein